MINTDLIFFLLSGDKVDAIGPEDGVVTVLRSPEHGALDADFKYTPQEGFLGKDKVEIFISVDGYKIKAVGFYNVVPKDVYDKEKWASGCKKPLWWQISKTLEDNPVVSVKTSLAFADLRPAQ